VVRYADHTSAGFEHRADAERYRPNCATGWRNSPWICIPDKTRLVEFGRNCAIARKRGDGKPETFDFLGFTHICALSRRGGLLLARHTRRDRSRARLREIKKGLRRRGDQDVAKKGRWLASVMRGSYLAYHAVPTNSRALGAFRHHVVDLWRRALRRRSQRDRTTWADMQQTGRRHLPRPVITHPWPSQRFCVRQPR
jgi:hypothetical protein